MEHNGKAHYSKRGISPTETRLRQPLGWEQRPRTRCFEFVQRCLDESDRTACYPREFMRMGCGWKRSVCVSKLVLPIGLEVPWTDHWSTMLRFKFLLHASSPNLTDVCIRRSIYMSLYQPSERGKPIEHSHHSHQHLLQRPPQRHHCSVV